jgi:hypothetical protein
MADEPQDPQQPSPPDSAPPPYAAPPPWQQPYGGAPPPYGAPQYGQPYGAPTSYGTPPQYQQPRGTNGFAIASLICAFLCSPLGLIFGLVAQSQIRQNGQPGGGLATAGIVLSIAFFVLGIILVATGHAAFHVGTGSNGG